MASGKWALLVGDRVRKVELDLAGASENHRKESFAPVSPRWKKLPGAIAG